MGLVYSAEPPNVAVWSLLHLDEIEVARKVEEATQRFSEELRCWLYARPELPPYDQGRRYIDENIMFCFGAGYDPGITEMSLAYRLQYTAEAMPAHLVWDWHQNMGGPDFAFYGLRARQSQLAMGVASLIGPDAIVICYAGNPAAELSVPYVGADVSRNSPALDHLEGWLAELLDGWVPQGRPAREWLFAGNISTQDAQRLGLSGHLPSFSPLDDWIADELHLAKPLYVLAAGGFTDSKWWAEVITPFDPAKVTYNPLRL